MIRHLRIRNYRSHRDSSFSLEPLTVFVGPVASGKSNIFRALDFLRATVAMSAQEYFGPGHLSFQYFRSRSATEDEGISVESEIDLIPGYPDYGARYLVEVSERQKASEGPKDVIVGYERLERWKNDAPEQQTVLFEDPNRFSPPEFGEYFPHQTRLSYCLPFRMIAKDISHEHVRFAMSLAMLLYSMEYYHFEITSVQSPSPKGRADRLTYNGRSIPSFLFGLRESKETKPLYERIENELKEIVGEDFREIRLVPTEKGELGFAFQFGHSGEPYLPFELSDGTLMALAILCLANQPPRVFHRPKEWGDLVIPTRVLCLEEPENTIHPRLLQWLFDKLVMLAYPDDGREPTQVLISTHSPYLVDLFKDHPASIRVVEAEDGISSVRPLNEDEIATDVALGEQWYMGLLGGV